MPEIHSTALVSPEAELAEGVVVGPRAIVEAGVRIGEGTRVGAGAIVCTGSALGRENVVHMYAVIGNEPQDRNYEGEATFVEIGNRNVIREFVTIHRGSEAGSVTRIGSDCLLMATSHVAHNCIVGDEAIVTNGALLGGHAEVGERAFVSGCALVHQFVRVGRLAMVAGGARAIRDVPPFTMMEGENRLRGLNRVGLSRAGFPAETMSEIGRAFREMFMRKTPPDAAAKELLAGDPPPVAEVREMAEFVLASLAPGGRGLCAYRKRR